MYEYVGALHMHSTFSDGSGEVADIAKAADEVALDYIILTDHNTMRAFKEGFENWYGNSLLLVGCEINDKENKNHYLAFGIEEAFSTRISAKEYVKSVKEQGGIGFLAHPHEKRTHMKEHPPYPWVDWEIEEFDGIEIWNHMSEWMENLTEENKYQAFMHPLRSIIAPPVETLRIWDELNQKRKVVAIGGVDAHAHKYNLLGFLEVEIFPYKVLFKSIRTHILTNEEIKKPLSQMQDRDGDISKEMVKQAKKIIYKALGNGNSFVANDYHGDSKGFRFFAECSNKFYQMGETITGNNKVKFQVLLPVPKASVKLIRNGKLIDEVETDRAHFIVDKKGAYRVEVFLNSKAWIYSNHIKIV